MRNCPTILKTELLAESDYFQIEALHLQFSNGQQRIYERLRGTGYRSVMLVAMPDPLHVLLVREYAVGVEKTVLGLPKERNPMKTICKQRNESSAKKSDCALRALANWAN
ncbi:hypothetical protein [Pseudomonas sp. VD9]|uniref:hypothetical protein n=1 Tax=Pseudomonas sp. VD9 TaxID=3342076 RepID=UPI003C6C6A68